MTTKRKWSGIVLALMLALVLCGCGTKEKPEKEVVADLQASRWFISENLEIKSYEITKRQTDVENKKDIIYVTVHTNEPEMTCDLSYVMEYVLYNDGWVLEAVRKDEEGMWSIEGLKEEQLLEDIKQRDGFFSNEENALSIEVSDYKINDTWFLFDGSEYRKGFSISLTGNGGIRYKAEYRVEYCIDENGWSNQSFERLTYSYSPLSLPDNSITDKVMNTLGYDKYEHIETAWGTSGRTATVQYAAYLKHKYGTEKYIVNIPVIYTLDGSGTGWCHNDKRSIWTELSNIDWDIKGVWKQAENDSYYDRYVMEILEVKETAIRVKAYNQNNGTVYLNADVPFDSKKGAAFDIQVSNSFWDTLDMNIGLDMVYIKGFGTRKGCEYRRV